MTTTIRHVEVERCRAAVPAVAIGTACVVAGGLVAAFSAPMDIDHGSWVAAFLVLIGGVAQIALGAGQAWLAERAPRRRTIAAQEWSWNLGGVAVLAGTLVSLPVLTSIGGLSIAISLALFANGTRSRSDELRKLVLLYRCVVVFVLASIPVGIALAWLRHG